MEMQEFSSPREEFSAVGQEFASPAPEFFQPAPETRAVPEAHTAPEQAEPAAEPVRERKKRRVNPLMLTTAAVATAAVTLAGVDVAVPDIDLSCSAPTITLSAEHREYVDTIIAALDAQDVEQLHLLTGDPRMAALAEEAVEFLKPLAEKGEAAGCSFTDERNFDFSAIYRDGRFSGTGIAASGREVDLDVFYHDYSDTGSYSRQIHTYDYGDSDYDYFTERSYSLSQNGNGSLGSAWEIREVSCDIIRDPLDGSRTAVPLEGVITYRHTYDDGVSYTQWEIRGTAAHEYVEERETGYFRPYLENGTYTVTLSEPGKQADTFVFEVVDGVTQIGDAEVTQQEVSGELYFQLVVTRSDGSTYSPASGQYESEEDFLYHTFLFS